MSNRYWYYHSKIIHEIGMPQLCPEGRITRPRLWHHLNF